MPKTTTSKQNKATRATTSSTTRGGKPTRPRAESSSPAEPAAEPELTEPITTPETRPSSMTPPAEPITESWPGTLGDPRDIPLRTRDRFVALAHLQSWAAFLASGYADALQRFEEAYRHGHGKLSDTTIAYMHDEDRADLLARDKDSREHCRLGLPSLERSLEKFRSKVVIAWDWTCRLYPDLAEEAPDEASSPGGAERNLEDVGAWWRKVARAARVELGAVSAGATLPAIPQVFGGGGTGDADTDLADRQAQGIADHPAASTAPGTVANRVTVEKAKACAERHVKASGWPGSRRHLRDLCKCSFPTITKVIAQSKILQEAEARFIGENQPRKPTVPHGPQHNVMVDETLRALIECADEADRGKLNTPEMRDNLRKKSPEDLNALLDQARQSARERSRAHN